MAGVDHTEEWRGVEGWPEYEVSNLGRLRRVTGTIFINPRNGQSYVSRPGGSILKQKYGADGYQRANLSRNGKTKTLKICVLVCLAFNGPKPTPKHNCAHDDGDKTNDRASNLIWKTYTENNRDRIRHGTIPHGEKFYNAVLKTEQVKEIKRLISFENKSCSELSRAFEVSYGVIYNIKHGFSWKDL